VCAVLEKRAAAITVGPASDAMSDIGPLISAPQAERVKQHIDGALEQGAKLLVGGETPADLPAGGHYVAPTVLFEVSSDMDVAQVELFGPVLSVLRYDTVDDACRIANDSSYGLAASVWGAELRRAREVAQRIDAGTVWVNDFAVSDVRRSPFGGRKQSGIGAEFGVEGLLGYTRPKSVYTALDQNVDERPYSLVGFGWD
jgi:acyl-CoA reductase-like NAD-dependent aldehyde dehydrogenase